MKSNYVPLEDRVVVSVPKTEEKTESGIYIPEEARTAPYVEVVVEAVGDGVKSNGQAYKMFLTKGQTVAIGVNTGMEYKVNGKTFRILRQEDVLFLVNDVNQN